jgi:hypothetical protein
MLRVFWSLSVQATVLLALLQPAPETFDLFDDIMLLSEGMSGARISVQHTPGHGSTRKHGHSSCTAPVTESCLQASCNILSTFTLRELLYTMHPWLPF